MSRLERNPLAPIQVYRLDRARMAAVHVTR